MTLKLKKVLAAAGYTQSALAREVKLSEASIAQMVNHNKWPRTCDVVALKQQILEFLDSTDDAVFEEEGTSGDQTAGHDDLNNKDQQELVMLLRKQVLSQQAKQTFGILRDPFAEPRNADEVYLSADARYVRENLRDIAKHGGFCAVVGESGAGKTTLKRDLVQWALDVQQEVIVIEPYVLGMEDNDQKGKTLKAAAIAEAILHAVAPGERVYRSSEARFRQVHEALKQSYRSGHKHVLIIEEAHCLSIPTLKHLKRFIELEDGFSKLLSVVLIGQPELGNKLDERNPRLREVVQRCEVIHLNPLNNELEAYLQQRFAQAGVDMALVLPEDAVAALRAKLTGGNGQWSLLYPLAVHNVLTGALNEAARLGIPQLTADLVKGV